MALPALSKTYHTRRDITYPDTSSTLNILRSYLWLVKESLIDAVTGGFTGPNSRPAASVWTVHSSSNSTSTSASDLWGTGTFTAGNLVFNNHGSAHSWICLQNTTMGFYLVLDCQPASTTTSALISAWRISDGLTAGTTLVRPRPPVPASAELNLGYLSEATNNHITVQSDTTVSATYRLNATYANDGFFYFLSSRNAQGYHNGGFSFQRGVTSGSFPANPSDPFNFFLVNFSTSTTTPGVPTVSTISSNTNTSQIFPTGARCSTGSGISQVNFGGTSWGGTTTFVQDYYTVEFDTVPLYVRGATSTGSVNRGLIPDWWVHSNRSVLVNNTVNDPGGVVSHVVAGDLFLPWNGSIPTL